MYRMLMALVSPNIETGKEGKGKIVPQALFETFHLLYGLKNDIMVRD